jgi:enoyl-CoA hydratase/carnithine racemase
MGVVETEQSGGIMVIRMNRPERLNAISAELRRELASAWCTFRDSSEAEVAIFTGTGRAFCAGEDMKESLERGAPGLDTARLEDPYSDGTLRKPVIAAINGFAMGGGFMLAEKSDLRVAVPDAVFEMSEAKRWLLGGYQHGRWASLPHPILTEMAFSYRFTAERLHQLGFINWLASPEELMPRARAAAEHLLSLPPASRLNTLTMTRALRPTIGAEHEGLADRLRNHGAKEDMMESRRAFAEKRPPVFKGWDDPADRARTPRP